VATHWHAFLKPELHGLLTPRASFLSSRQTDTCLTGTSTVTYGPTYRTRAFVQIETKRRTRVLVFVVSLVHSPRGKNADLSSHVAGRDRGHGRWRNNEISRHRVNPPMALFDGVELVI